MNSRVIVPAPTARQYAARNESHIAGRQAVRRYRPIIRSPQRVSDTKPQPELAKIITLDSSMELVITGNIKRVLPIGHSPCPIVALRAHAARGNGLKAKAENNRKERKLAAPLPPFVALP